MNVLFWLGTAVVLLFGCKRTPDVPPVHATGVPDTLEVWTPESRDTLCPPVVVVEGRARGWWYFEATFPVTVLDVHGQPIGEFYATALDEWMTSGWVRFRGEIPIRVPQGVSGTVVFERSNASGLPEHDRRFSLPVNFKEACDAVGPISVRE